MEIVLKSTKCRKPQLVLDHHGVGFVYTHQPGIQIADYVSLEQAIDAEAIWLDGLFSYKQNSFDPNLAQKFPYFNPDVKKNNPHNFLKLYDLEAEITQTCLFNSQAPYGIILSLKFGELIESAYANSYPITIASNSRIISTKMILRAGLSLYLKEQYGHDKTLDDLMSVIHIFDFLEFGNKKDPQKWEDFFNIHLNNYRPLTELTSQPLVFIEDNEENYQMAVASAVNCGYNPVMGFKELNLDVHLPKLS